MAEPIKISTKKYNSKGKVDIDGNIWDVTLPGAGTEMRLSQCFRQSKIYTSRMSLVDKKIDNGTVTETDLNTYQEYSDKYEETQKSILDIFMSIFSDGTEENELVKKWINDTPTAILELAFQDVTNQANGKDENSAGTTASS